MRLVIAGGGTGGHLFPGIAVAETFLVQKEGREVMFLGAHGGLEERYIPRLGYKLELLPTIKGGSLRKLRNLGPAYLRARRSLLRFKADAVVGMGGYGSVAPVLAAWGIEIPTMILEQNVIPGKANRFLSRFAGEIGVQFVAAGERFPSRKRIRHVGNPLRSNVRKKADEVSKCNTELMKVPENPTLLVLGGSQGARAINEVIIRVWPRLRTAVPNLRIILLSGEAENDRTVREFASADIRGKVIPFSNAMEDLYSEAHVVVARAGATTLSEIAAFGLPSILIPYPYAADDHQKSNAQIFAGAGASWVMMENEIELDRLARRVADVILQPERRRQMAVAAHRLDKPDSAEKIIERIIWMSGLNSSVHKTLTTNAPAV